MRDRLPILAAVAGFSVLLAYFSPPASGQTREAPATGLVLFGGTIYVNPEDEPIPDGAVVIQDGKIVAAGPKAAVQIPGGAETLDCSGLTITAGLQNSHVHFMERKWAGAAEIPAAELEAQLQAMLTRYGFTSVFDTGSDWENTRRIRDRIESGEVQGPRIRSTGAIIFPKDAGSPEVVADVLGFMRSKLPEVADAAEAAAAARRHLDAGVDGIKLYAQTFWPPRIALPAGAIPAAVSEAHDRGKPVFAHPTSREGLLASVEGGVDVLVHTTPQSAVWDETVIAAMKKRGVALIPTLKLWEYELRHDRISARERFVKTGVEQLRAWVAAGGTILFGTDVGYMGDYDPSDEYALMADAGMSFRQILASLTTNPAERFGEPESGKIAPGLAADLVVLGEDPAMDVRRLAAVRYTIRGGMVIYRGR